jgi:hypothetical protein
LGVAIISFSDARLERLQLAEIRIYQFFSCDQSLFILTIFERIWVLGEVDQNQLGVSEKEKICLFVVAFALVNLGL